MLVVGWAGMIVTKGVLTTIAVGAAGVKVFLGRLQPARTSSAMLNVKIDFQFMRITCEGFKIAS
jgi:hypothetical protein